MCDIRIVEAWQTPCWDAVKEFNLAKLRELVPIAEAAVSSRSEQIADSIGDNDEKLALKDTWTSLCFLRWLFAAKV
jgi:hypothetical protein